MRWINTLNKREFWTTLVASLEEVGTDIELSSETLPADHAYGRNVIDYFLLLMPYDYQRLGGNRFANIIDHMEVGLPGGVDGLPGNINIDGLKERVRSSIRVQHARDQFLKVEVDHLALVWRKQPVKDFPTKIFLQGVRIKYKSKKILITMDKINLVWSDRGPAFPRTVTLRDLTLTMNNRDEILEYDATIMVAWGAPWDKMKTIWSSASWMYDDMKRNFIVYFPRNKTTIEFLPELMAGFDPFETCPFGLEYDSTSVYMINEEFLSL